MRSMLARSILCLLLLTPVLALAQESTTDAAAEPAAAAVAPTASIEAEAAADTTAAAETEAAVDAEAGADAAADAPAAAPALDNPLIGPAPQDKGQIVFFRESKMMGAAIGFKVREGETELGKLRSGRYFVALVEPGVHEYTVHSETKDVLTIEVEPGETYYVLGSLGMGILAGRPNLSPSDEATFLGMSKKLKLAK